MSARSTVDLDQLSHRQLQDKCKKSKISSSGTSAVLRKRLRAREVAQENSTKVPPSKRQKKSPADDLICPITLELPWEPVMAEDGRVYERAAIEKHFKTHAGGTLKSPITNKEIGQRLIPAPQHRNTIETLVEMGVIAGDLASKWNEQVEKQKEKEGLLKKAESGDGPAMHEVGISYTFGWYGFKKDAKLALEWYKKAHAAGELKGTARLGEFLCRGFAGETCHKLGMMYTTVAAAQGSNLGSYHLGLALADGKFGMVVNSTEAIHWLEKSLDEDCPHSDMGGEVKNKARQRLGELQALPSSAQAPESS